MSITHLPPTELDPECRQLIKDIKELLEKRLQESKDNKRFNESEMLEIEASIRQRRYIEE